MNSRTKGLAILTFRRLTYLCLLALLLTGCDRPSLEVGQVSAEQGVSGVADSATQADTDTDTAKLTERSHRQVVPASTDSTQVPPIGNQETAQFGSQIVSQTPRITAHRVVPSSYEEHNKSNSGLRTTKIGTADPAEINLGITQNDTVDSGIFLAGKSETKDLRDDCVDRPEASLNQLSQPEAVCRVFLDALAGEDSIAAARMLTDTAQVETARANLQLESPGVAGSTFQVLPAEYATTEKQIAQVTCLLQQPGRMPVVQLTWMMRYQPNGWKISGMAIGMSDNGPADLLSFENPADLQRIQQSVGGSAADIQVSQTADSAQR